MILVEIQDAHGRVIGRCDETCYNARNSHCRCVCHGSNHGVGLHRAAANTRDHAKDFLLAWARNHPHEKPELVFTHKLIDRLADQLELPLE